ncbi:hypothetical protein H4219_006106 [Mycoemilia scoparia]|uniref:Uncharacterized protein n=1 Tax=Mycoemilia scoparia TaxID=417184 RepID=A0A9W7ZLL6_9FUNG|nr:hypothetical protein H4219_006106 [Mycoemilia scoparia]
MTLYADDPLWKRILKKCIVRKPLEQLLAESNSQALKRTLGKLDLIAVGIGAIIGTGIFVLTGTAAAVHAGPSIIISFLVAGLASALAAFSYSEMASMIPVSGSAYTFTSATMGEFMAWVIGWDLILEYLVGSATVAAGFSGYIVNFFADAFKVKLTPKTTRAPLKWNSKENKFEVVKGSYVNIPAIFIVALVTAILVFGIRESSTVNTIIVTIKLIVIILFIFGSIKYVNRDNYTPFVPERDHGEYGAIGIFKGAQQVFFAYIGFDAVSCTAQECKNPQKDLPWGICISLVVCTSLYVAVSAVLTGIANYTTLNVPAPISFALEGFANTRWLRIIIDLGAIAGLTSVILVLLMAQPRIFWSMARDGLFPRILGRTHHRFKTPYVPTLICGTVTAVLAGFLPIDVLGDMTSVGTLLAFALTQIGVMIMRYTDPNAQRGFKVPFGPYVLPPIGAAICILLLVLSGKQPIMRLFIWLGIGIIIYVVYGYRHSRINNPEKWESDPFNDPQYTLGDVESKGHDGKEYGIDDGEHSPSPGISDDSDLKGKVVVHQIPDNSHNAYSGTYYNNDNNNNNNNVAPGNMQFPVPEKY